MFFPSILYRISSILSVMVPVLSYSPSTGDKLGGIAVMLGISAVGLITLVLVSVIVKHRKK